MTISLRQFRLPAAVAAGTLPLVALAHPGTVAAHAHGFAAGFVHPFTGLDHLAAMLAVGVWSAGSQRRAWSAPAAFIACLLAGALATSARIAVPGAEAMIAASLLVLGLLLALRAVLAPAAAAVIVGVTSDPGTRLVRTCATPDCRRRSRR